jgi:hypothetical protein
MAERFVYGFRIQPDKFHGIVKSGVPASEVIGSLIVDETDELLEEACPDEPITTEEAIAAITSGALDEEHAYEYRRVTEVIAESIGERFGDEIDMITTYYLPNDSSGRWNPVLEKLGLNLLAAQWGETNTAFPWSDGEQNPTRVDWPTLTLLSADQVFALATELDEVLDSDAIARLPADVLHEYGKEEEAASAREELGTGLQKLRSWCAQALAKDWGLLLIMDGSQ